MLSGAIDYVSANAGGAFPSSAEEAINAYQTNSGIYLRKDDNKAYIGSYLSADSFGLVVGDRSKSFKCGLSVGQFNNKYVKTARSNAAIGTYCEAYGTASQAFGEYVCVSAGMAIGSFNKTSACSFVIGNGTSNTARSDIFVINYDGSVSAAGKISANGVELGGGGVTGEFVPQSAFDELKQSYDALSSLFATYSGQWLLPNEGV